jgi:hypothetical protein
MTDSYRNNSMSIRSALLTLLLSSALVISVFNASHAQEVSRDSADKIAAGENVSQDSSLKGDVTEKEKEKEKKDDEQTAIKDPISASGDDRFIPTEEISEDLPVSFPVDI